MDTLSLTPDELLTTTRAVRKRLDLDRPVPLGLVRECLEVALQAPTGERQGWHWMVVTDPALRAAIGEHYRRSVEAYRASPGFAGRLHATTRRRRPRCQGTGRRRVGVPGRGDGAGAGARRPVHRAQELPAGNQAGLWGSLLPAAWSYMLAARARGLGTAWTTLHLRYEKEVAELLGLPADVRQGVLMPTAYYTGESSGRPRGCRWTGPARRRLVTAAQLPPPREVGRGRGQSPVQ